MTIEYIAEDGSKFADELSCLRYEKSVVPLFYAVDIYRTGGTKHHHETLIGVYETEDEAYQRIEEISSKRTEDLNQRYEVRKARMFKHEQV